ncbi:hypothetical protein [Levilactobacillus sp. HBUAS70063]|uniref:hypothetical protein n=1 Tax=Levilactobacillus sp. HBUAS70063 TaxID=3109359 RepID=UPI003132DB82
MQDAELDETGDFQLDNGDILTVSGDDELAQAVKIIIQSRLSEFEPAEELGISTDNMYGKNISTEYLATDISDAIMEQEPRVATVTSVQVGKPDEDRNVDVKVEFVKNDDTAGTLETGVSLDD